MAACDKKMVVTKSETDVVLGLGDVGLGDVGRGTRDAGLGDVGLGDARGLGDVINKRHLNL